MKKLLLSINMLCFTSVSVLSVTACAIDQTLTDKINKIINFREIPGGYKYIDLWRNLMVENAGKMNTINNSFLWELRTYSERWFNEERLNLPADTNPLSQTNLTDAKFAQRIYLDFEFPYANSPQSQYFGANVVTSTLMDKNFFQIYNYQYLKDLGYRFEVTISNNDKHNPVIKILNATPDANGAIYLQGTMIEGSEQISIVAYPQNDNSDLETLSTYLNVQNAAPDSNSFIQWKTYQYIKNEYQFSDTFQELVATYLVQIHAQLMYNYSYNTKPGLLNKIALLDANMLDMLYCAAIYGQYVNYAQYWPSGDTDIAGFGLYYSFDFYLHAQYQHPHSVIPQLNSNPVVSLSTQLLEYANKVLNIYETLNAQESEE